MAFPNFDGYVEQKHGGWGPAGECAGCYREAPRISKGDGQCEWCLQYMFGAEETEHEVASTLAGLLAPVEKWGA